MKACQKCGWQDAEADICIKCGFGMFKILDSASSEELEQMSVENKLSKFFMEPTEKFICALGNSFLKNFLLNGSINYGFAAVSDKRVYFKGSCFAAHGKGYKLTQEERIVDVKDITGTGYTRITPFKLHKQIVPISLVTLLISLPFMFFVAGGGFVVILFFLGNIIFNLLYFLLHRINVFEIQYAGGKIAFDSNWYDKAEVDDFQRQIRLAKDKATSINQPMRQVQQQATSSLGMADELKKFADLLSQGIITREEFEQAKADLLKRRG